MPAHCPIFIYLYIPVFKLPDEKIICFSNALPHGI
jgi:hypothetical protein